MPARRDASAAPPLGEPLARGGFAPLAYRLGVREATGCLHVEDGRGAPARLPLRRGRLALGDAPERELARAAALAPARWRLEPDGPARAGAVFLARWARRHLERQVDARAAARLWAALGTTRVCVRRDLAPPPPLCDATDRRALAAMARPADLDTLLVRANAPRLRLASLVHFLRSVGALTLVAVDARAGAAAAATPAHPVALAPPWCG